MEGVLGQCDHSKNLVCNLVATEGFVHVQVGMFTLGYLREGRGLGSQGRVVLEH